jgi:predicted MPP superfamily phosphohydrolase
LQTGLLGAAGLALYASEVERHWVEVVETDARIVGLPEAFDGVRMVQISDIHMDAYTEPFFLRHVVHKVNELRPDLIMLTGDYVSETPASTDFNIGAAWQCANILTELVCKRIYAVLGNHDVSVGIEPVTEALTSNGIAVLSNRYIPIEREGSRIWLAGTGDAMTGHSNLELAIPTQIRDIAREPLILLSHEPDAIDHFLKSHVASSIALMLSGHTHGGQVRLPFYGPLTLPSWGKKYVDGWFQFGSHPGATQLYVNRGIGTVGVPVRFACPPEITLFTLRRA